MQFKFILTPFLSVCAPLSFIYLFVKYLRGDITNSFFKRCFDFFLFDFSQLDYGGLLLLTNTWSPVKIVLVDW